MFQAQLFCLAAFIATFIPYYTLAGSVSSRVAQLAPVEELSVSSNQANSFDEVTKSLDDLPFDSYMSLFSLEVEEMMSAQWKSSSLALLPVEMLPLLEGVRHVIVDDILALAAVFNEVQNFETIDLTPLNGKKNGKHDIKLMVKLLAAIMERQAEYPPFILGLEQFFENTYMNDLFLDAIWEDEYDFVKILLSTPKFRSLIGPAACGNAAIYIASSKGNADMVELLLADRRVDPSARDNAAIRHAAINRHADVVKLLRADRRVNAAVL